MSRESLPGVVVAVSRNPLHQFSKSARNSIRLLAGLGVEGDAHLGVTVQHRSRMSKDPTRPNLRQVHLIHEKLLDELNADGFQLAPGQLERISRRGILTCSRCHGERAFTLVMPQS